MQYFDILNELGEFQEFTDALFGQLSVEIDEEKEIIKLASRANDDIGQKVKFDALEGIATEVFSNYKSKVEVVDLRTIHPLDEELVFKRVKNLV